MVTHKAIILKDGLLIIFQRLCKKVYLSQTIVDLDHIWLLRKSSGSLKEQNS